MDKMHRSRTVTPSIVIMLLWLVGWVTGLIPSHINQDSGIWWWLGLPFFAAVFRILVLYYQTLVHVIARGPKHMRTQWIIGHVVLGALASIWYYYAHKVEPVKRVGAVKPQ